MGFARFVRLSWVRHDRGEVMRKVAGTRAMGAAMMVLLTFSGPAAAQRQAAGGSDWCSQDNWGDDRQGFCEVREYTVPASGGTMTVDASPNGGISVEGSSRGDIFVQARVVATAAT